jgi:5'-3' exonuclease
LRVHLVDGTYELFRSYHGAPPATGRDGQPVGAVRGILRSLHSLLREPGVTHIGVAFDHVIESFRNELFAGYKTGEGLPEDLLAQFGPVERAAHALGLVVWPMVEFEADDAIATAALRFSAIAGVEQVVICTPDKDLAQCVSGEKVVRLDRMRRLVLDEAGVKARFGVPPSSIPDWLALVGDDADGIPGIPRWGEKSASAVLGRFLKVEAIPDHARMWGLDVRGADALAKSLRERRAEAVLYRTLATLRTDVPLAESLPDLEWRGARRDELRAICDEVGESETIDRIQRFR